MDKKHLQIEKAVKNCYAIIKKANEDLESLRKVCEHPETELCNYQWGGPGHVLEGATVCSICGELLGNPFSQFSYEITTSAE